MKLITKEDEATSFFGGFAPHHFPLLCSHKSFKKIHCIFFYTPMRISYLSFLLKKSLHKGQEAQVRGPHRFKRLKSLFECSH